MADFNVTLASVQDSLKFLQAFLENQDPTVDWTPGSPDYQIVVKGNAYPVAFLRDAIERVRNEKSLLSLRGAGETQDVVDMADAILANLLVTRAAGRFTRGVALLKFSRRTDQRVPVSTRLFKTSALVYYPDYTSDVIVSATDMRAVTGSRGEVIYYTYPINIKAARTGDAYDQDAGSFDAVDPFSPYLLGADNPAPLGQGRNTQSTADAIDTASDAMASRSLGNARSNSVVIRNNFDVDDVLSIGHGDPEMTRDILVSSIGRLHLGGKADLYVRAPTKETTVRRTIGGSVARADGRAVTFRDATPPGGTFTAANVQPGDILSILSGIPEAPIQYRIDAVRDNEVDISTRTPFSVATDESPASTIKYSIGNNYPVYNNRVDVLTGTLTANTSRGISTKGRVTLDGGPVYAISKVEMLGPIPSGLNNYVDPVSGRVLFSERRNTQFLGPIASTTSLPYRVTVLNQDESQSSRALTQIEVIWPSANYDGSLLEITYTTLADFDAVSAYVTSTENRPDPADYLVRARHPVYVSFSVPYALRVDSSVTSRIGRLLAASPTFDASRASISLARYINTYKSSDPIDRSGLVTQLRFDADVALATIYDFTVEYELLAPSGGVYRYSTTDKVTIFPDGTTGASLLNPTDFGLPTSGYYAALKQQLQSQGVSDRNIRFMTTPDAIVFAVRV